MSSKNTHGVNVGHQCPGLCGGRCLPAPSHRGASGITCLGDNSARPWAMPRSVEMRSRQGLSVCSPDPLGSCQEPCGSPHSPASVRSSVCSRSPPGLQWREEACPPSQAHAHENLLRGSWPGCAHRPSRRKAGLSHPSVPLWSLRQPHSSTSRKCRYLCPAWSELSSKAQGLSNGHGLSVNHPIKIN